MTDSVWGDLALELDCRELLCPMPVIELAKQVNFVEIGSLIGVTTKDIAARTDIPAWCRMRAHEYVGEDTAPDGVVRHVVRRLK